jgi:hypothetical protein
VRAVLLFHRIVASRGLLLLSVPFITHLAVAVAVPVRVTDTHTVCLVVPVVVAVVVPMGQQQA